MKTFVDAFADLMRTRPGVRSVRVYQHSLESGTQPFRRVKTFSGFKPAGVDSPCSLAWGSGHAWEYDFGRYGVTVSDTYGSGAGLYAKCSLTEKFKLFSLLTGLSEQD